MKCLLEALTASIKINIHYVCPPLKGVLSKVFLITYFAGTFRVGSGDASLGGWLEEVPSKWFHL